MVGLAEGAVSLASTAYGAYNSSKGKGNSGGGPSGGSLQNAFGTPNQIYSRNPSWVNDASQTNYANAQKAASQPYQAYTGQQAAPLSTNQQLANQYAQNSVGRYAPTYDSITGYLNQQATPNTSTYTPGTVNPTNVSTQGWNADAANQYMSPYVQAALQPQINNINQNYAQRQNAMNQAAAGSGNFGGDRAAVNSALLTKQQQDEINGVTAQGYNTAYNSGLGAFQSDQARNLQGQQSNQAAGINTGEFNQGQNAAAFNTNFNTAQANRQADLNAASGLNNLVGTRQGVLTSNINNLLNTGNPAQQTQQNQDTTGYQNYLNQLYYPEQQASYLQGLLGNGANTGSLASQQGAIGQSGVSGLAGSVSSLLGGGGSGGLLGSIGGLFGGSGGGSPMTSPSYSPVDFSSGFSMY